MPIVSPSPFRSFARLGAVAFTLWVGAASLGACGSRGPAPDSVAAVAAVVDSPTSPTPSVMAAPNPAASGGRDQSELVVSIIPATGDDAPAELLVTDPGGKRTGVDPAGYVTLREILHAWYDSAPPPTQTDGDPEPGPLTKQFLLTTPPPGRYVLAVVGRRAGGYSVQVRVTTPAGDVREGSVSDLRTAPGDVRRFSVSYDPSGTGPVPIERH